VSDLELCQFEDFIKHLDYTEAATIKYPLEYLPFYHFDARRFNAPVDMIERYHDFYLFESDERHRNKIKRLDTRKIVGSIQGRDKFQFQMDLQQLKEKVLHQDRGEWTKGLFWGIKMYTAMGYPPYLFDHAASQEIFPCLQPGSYTRLLEFYEYCADHDIPVTCHGSPQGMTLADPGIYLKEYLKKRSGTRYARSGKINFCINGRGFMHGIGLVDTFSSPLSWEKVIDRMSNGSKLKLCLAHFGGKDFL
jgi:hypothetical protein